MRATIAKLTLQARDELSRLGVPRRQAVRCASIHDR